MSYEIYRRRATAYLACAELAIEKMERGGESLQAPALHLTAHAYELVLKANLLRKSRSPADIRKFGHDIHRLFLDPDNSSFKERLEDADPQVGEYLKMLSEFHTSATNYTLRYPNETPTMNLAVRPLKDALRAEIEGGR